MKSLSEIASLALLSDSRLVSEYLNIENLNLKATPFFKQFFVSTINDKNITRYQNEVVYTHGTFENYNKVRIDHLIVNLKLGVQKFNGKAVENVKKFIQSLVESTGVIVKGNIVMNKGFSLSGSLDGVKIFSAYSYENCVQKK